MNTIISESLSNVNNIDTKNISNIIVDYSQITFKDQTCFFFGLEKFELYVFYAQDKFFFCKKQSNIKNKNNVIRINSLPNNMYVPLFTIKDENKVVEYVELFIKDLINEYKTMDDGDIDDSYTCISIYLNSYELSSRCINNRIFSDDHDTPESAKEKRDSLLEYFSYSFLPNFKLWLYTIKENPDLI